MKQKILLSSILVLCLGLANAQWISPTTSWRYSFPGTTQSNFTTVGAVNLSPGPTPFLPVQASDTSYVLIRAGGGSFVLDSSNFPNSLAMNITASTNKWGVYGVDSSAATSVAHLSFRIMFDSVLNTPPTAGAIVNVGIGTSTTAGTFFKGNNTIGTKPTATYNCLFTNLRMLYSSSGSPNFTLQYRQSGSQTSTVNADITGGAIVSGVPYTIDVYCNDSTAAQNYTGPDGSVYTVAPASFHLWEDAGGVKKHLFASSGPTVYDFPRCADTATTGPVTMADNTKLNSFFFQAGGAGGTTAIFDSVITLEYVILKALPVSFMSFNAQLMGKSVQLNWETASEQNNAYFEVLRSADGNTFNSIGKVPGNLTTDIEHNYSFTDDSPYSGINYYKLKQVDVDGQTAYNSNIVVVDAPQQQDAFKVCMTGNQLNATAYSATAGNRNLQIFSVSGQQLLNTIVQLNEGENHFTVNVSSLQSGVYIAVIKDNNQEESVKFMK